MYSIRYPNKKVFKNDGHRHLRDAILTARMSQSEDYYIIDTTANEICWNINDDILERISLGKEFEAAQDWHASYC
jgi:adenosine deaminase